MSQLLLVTSLLSTDMARGLGELGLSETRAHVLWELGAREPPTQKRLADVLKVTPRNVTALIDALEETGFVRRDPHPTDRRAVVVVLSDKGRQTVATLRSQMASMAEQLFGAAPEADLQAFGRTLDALAVRLAELSGQDALP